jgi:L-asparaginase II
MNLDVVATRGTLIESRHRVHAAVVDATGTMRASAGDAELTTWWRSCAKPFQVMPLVTTGGFDSVGWGDDELALACASHGGEPEHVALADSMLDSIGLEEGDLACGPHEPLTVRGLRLLRESGARVTRLHNNCSGKHAAMLGMAHASGWPTFGYERQEHPVQRAIEAVIGDWSGLAPSALGKAIDGCGVVVFSLPLRNMAMAWARLGAASADGDDMPGRILHAMATRPFLVGGTDRFDSVLIEETEGRIISKVGAEGVHSLVVPSSGLGAALKVEDGGQRAQFVAVIRLLQELGELPKTLPPRLQELGCKTLRNSRGESIGELRPVG